jgi:thiol-disulfide isomerase/thioredoxin
MYIKVSSDNDALNLSKLINDGNWMVLYYADWCGHCKTMKPEWQQVVNKLNTSNKNTDKINVAEIESQHIGKLLNKPEIEGFPTIKMYNNGKPIADFDEERVASKIEEFANNNAEKHEAKHESIHESKHEAKHENMKNNMKNNINSIVQEDTIEKPKELQLNNIIIPIHNIHNIHDIHNKNTNHKNILNLPCNTIRRAKICKSNPKCMYDGTDFKCKDKMNIYNNAINNKNNKNNMVGNIIFKDKHLHKSKHSHKPKHTHKSKHSHKHKHSHKSKHSHRHKNKHSKKNKNINVRKTTKSVFDQLIKSFGHIGNEAQKDSKLLKEASNKL